MFIFRHRCFLSACFLLCFITFILLQNGGCLLQQALGQPKQTKHASNSYYRTEMVALISEVGRYAREKNSSFILISNNGLELFNEKQVADTDSSQLLEQVDGILLEGFNYGGDGNDYKQTAKRTRQRWQADLQKPESQRLAILNVDYCKDVAVRKRLIQQYNSSKMINFAADRYELNAVPRDSGIVRENTSDITRLQQSENFLFLLNPSKFSSKQRYLNNLRSSNYDLLIIDLEFQGQSLSVQEVESLKIKRNGGRRLVVAYMSIGEAEDYRGYWQKNWSKQRPEWLMELNPDWPGNYKVRYWSAEWRQIVLGTEQSYLDRVLAVGFDGVFLDVVDAYEYFENL